MKDAYSFHIDQTSLEDTYHIMHSAYTRIFTRLGLMFRSVYADTGSIGGSGSQEFHVLAASGEDAIAFSNASDYAANVELAEALAPEGARPAAAAALAAVATPGQHSIADISAFLGITTRQCVKTLLVEDAEHTTVAFVLRGDHELNMIKAAKAAHLAAPLIFASAEQINTVAGCGAGSLGPLNLGVPVLVDRAAAHLADFVCGANRNGEHFTGVNWGMDLPEPRVADLRNVVAGDASPDGRGTLGIARGIEVGHIFQLGTKYSAALGASCLDEKGQPVVMTMGCYGIGVSRVVAAAIEQNNDARGIIWPAAIAPFHVALLPMNMHKSARVASAAQTLYDQLRAAGVEVLFDDRPVRPGVMFTDMELIGIPHRLVIGERGLDNGTIEYQERRETESRHLALSECVAFIVATLPPQ